MSVSTSVSDHTTMVTCHPILPYAGFVHPEANISKYLLADYYWPAFRASIKLGKAKGVMCSYNSVASSRMFAPADGSDKNRAALCNQGLNKGNAP